jgi:dienelactone hydrolase
MSWKGLRICVAVWLAAAAAVADSNAPADGLNEQILSIPMTSQGLGLALVATSYKPAGDGPFPLIVLTHGNPVSPSDRVNVGRYRAIPQIREFVRRGYAVVVVVRRGYGATGGAFAEDYASCTANAFFAAGREAARDVAAAVTYAAGLPYVDKARIVLMGQSAGGFAAVAAASLGLPGVVGVVNFSGGRGGDPTRHPGVPCGGFEMARAYGQFAATIKVPVLWHYVENDLFFGPAYSRAWFEAFKDAGGKGEYVLEPAFGKNGHGMFAEATSIPIWMPHVSRFLAGLGLPA